MIIVPGSVNVPEKGAHVPGTPCGYHDNSQTLMIVRKSIDSTTIGAYNLHINIIFLTPL